MSLMSGMAQDFNNTYYDPIFPDELGKKKPSLESVLAHYGPVRILNRWYFGADGFAKNDKNTISNTFDGLIGTRSVTGFGYAATVGWVYREEWAAEVSYARSPIYNVLTVSGTYPLEYRMTNDKNNLTLRVKRRLLFGKATLPKSAFWVGLGASLIPNSGRQKEYLVLEGYSRQGRLPVYDTLHLESVTMINNRVTGAVDASIEYLVKPAKGIEFSVYGRNQWGLGNSIATTIDYTVNRQDAGTSVINGRGSGWVFGISLRYTFNTTYDFENFNSPYKVGRGM